MSSSREVLPANCSNKIEEMSDREWGIGDGRWEMRLKDEDDNEDRCRLFVPVNFHLLPPVDYRPRVPIPLLYLPAFTSPQKFEVKRNNNNINTCHRTLTAGEKRGGEATGAGAGCGGAAARSFCPLFLMMMTATAAGAAAATAEKAIMMPPFHYSQAKVSPASP